MEQIEAKYRSLNNAAATTSLTNELCAGTLPDYKLFTYLVQDLKYFTVGLQVFGKALSLCDVLPSMLVIGNQIGFVCADENEYFDMCLAELKQNDEVAAKVPNMLKEEPVLSQVASYIEYMEYLAKECNSYVEVITSLYIMEKVYLDWAEVNVSGSKVAPNLAYKHQEWINLHYGPSFSKWVAFLRAEVSRTYITDPEACERAWKKTLELEVSFFDACYEYSEV